MHRHSPPPTLPLLSLRVGVGADLSDIERVNATVRSGSYCNTDLIIKDSDG